MHHASHNTVGFGGEVDMASVARRMCQSQCKTILIIQFMLLCAALCPGPSYATTRNPALEGVRAYDPLQDSHLVVRGTVISTQIKQIALGDLLIAEADDSQHAMLSNVQTMDVRVEEVLRGNAQPTTITFLIFPPVDLHKSQELVVCAKWIRGRKLSSFVTNPFLGLYEESAAGHWERLVDATSIVPRESFTNEELLKQVQEAGVAKLVAQSDVVASGSITRVWASTYHTDDGRVGELLHYELNVSDLLKGKDSDGALEFVVAKENLSFVPKWFRYTPKGLAVGQDWFVFLKTGERGLYPFAGPNSLLKVEDGRLLFDNAVTYPMDARDVTARVRAEVANAQE